MAGQRNCEKELVQVHIKLRTARATQSSFAVPDTFLQETQAGQQTPMMQFDADRLTMIRWNCIDIDMSMSSRMNEYDMTTMVDH
jgi:hypothetical protein